MLIYLATFSASFAFAFLAGRCSKSHGKTGFFVFSFISIMLLALLAGLRDYSIGIDTKNYLNIPIYWKGAYGCGSLKKYLDFYIADGNKEVLFALIIGLIAQTTGSYRVFLLFMHLFIVTCIYIGAVRQRKYIRFEFVPLFFCLLFFSHSMNIMRQYMAMTFVFAFFADIEERKYVRYGISVLIAMLIHTSAILLILPLGYYIILYEWKPKRKVKTNRKFMKKLVAADKTGALGKLTMQDTSFIKKLLLCVCIFIGELFMTTVFGMLIEMGYLNDKYTYYLESNEVSASTIVSGMLILELMGVALIWKDMRRKYPHASFWVICTVTDLAFQQLTSQMAYGKRIAGCFSLLNMLTLSLMVSSAKRRDKRIVVGAVVVTLCLAYWWYMYVFRNANQTVPYKIGI